MVTHALDKEGIEARLAAARAYGVDLSLLRASLCLTPAQRLARLDEAAAALTELRGAARRVTRGGRGSERGG
ncbi:MAG: hypothetical protein WKG32_19970 [Gemmatimonadaceae bacterium]